MTVFGERKTSAEFITPAIRIDRANSVLIRIAGTMKRAGKAQFEGRLPMREVVTVCLENGFLILKAASVILFRAQFQHVQAEPLRKTPSAVALRVRHGYNTELTLNVKKLTGWLKFGPEQTCNLFLKTLIALSAANYRAGSVASTLAAFKATGRTEFEGRIENEGIIVTIDETIFVVLGEKGNIICAPPAHIHAEVSDPIGENVVFRTRQG
jgi:hypothetical protein